MEQRVKKVPISAPATLPLDVKVANASGESWALVRDQAGFHLRDGDPRLPARVRVLDLPPYSPELNPCVWLWDVVKEEICN